MSGSDRLSYSCAAATLCVALVAIWFIVA